MRVCIVCNQAKDESEFGYRNTEKGHLQSVCIPCRRVQMRERYESNPENVKNVNKSSRQRAKSEAQRFISGYLETHHCVDCGESDPIVLTFDHNGNKKMNVADMVTQGYSVRSVEQEVNKCEVVCFNCHMRREYRRRSTLK